MARNMFRGAVSQKSLGTTVLQPQVLGFIHGFMEFIFPQLESVLCLATNNLNLNQNTLVPFYLDI